MGMGRGDRGPLGGVDGHRELGWQEGTGGALAGVSGHSELRGR